MNKIKFNFHPLILIIIALSCSTAFSLMMLLARFLYAQEIKYFFLIWNLFLAWVPFIISLFTYYIQQKFSSSKIVIFLLLLTWIVFFPNAPYVVTDFGHLPVLSSDDTLIWFDVILVFSFAINGLLLGFTSLYFVETILMKIFNRVFTIVFMVIFLWLASFGIYLGRFLRWNSWDAVSQPDALAYDIIDRFINPLTHIRTFAFTNIFFFFLISSYLVIRFIMLLDNKHKAQN